VPDYSNRDAVYNDLAAPGAAIFSTIPRQLTAADAGMRGPSVPIAGRTSSAKASATSFAAPQVDGGRRAPPRAGPTLRPEQVAWLLERSADDANPATAARKCPVGRDLYTGWGTLDVLNALTMLGASPLPPPDHYEPNDGRRPLVTRAAAAARTVTASLDYWDDNTGCLPRAPEEGDPSVFARLTPGSPAAVRLTLWAPATEHVEACAGHAGG